MKSLVTLSIIVVILAAIEPLGPFASSHDVAYEEFQVGPLFLEVGMRRTEEDPAQYFPSPIFRVGVNTDFSTSLDPLSVRVIVVLNFESDHSADNRQSAILHMPEAKQPSHLGGLLN